MIIKYRKPKGGLVGIDIGSTSIKKLELSKQGDTYQVEDYAVVPLPKGVVVDKSIEKVDVVVQHLERLLKSSSGVAFAIPTLNVVQRIESMDADLPAQEIHRNVLFQLDKFIPFPLSEVCMDYDIRDEKIGSRISRKVSIIAARNDSVKPKLEVLEMAGITANIVTVEDVAVEKVIPFIVKPSDGLCALFDFGYSTTVLYVIKDNKIIYSRVHDFGGVNLSNIIQSHYSCEADEVEAIRNQKIKEQDENFKNNILDPFVIETTQQFSQAIQLCISSSDVEQIDKVLISGGGALLEGLPESIEAELGYQTRIGCPFDNMMISTKINKAQFDKEKASLLTVCGLAMCEVGDTINLLPWREELETYKKRSYLIGAAVACLIGLGIALGGWSVVNSGYNSQVSANAKIKTVTEQVDKTLLTLDEVISLRDMMLERMRLIQGLDAQRPVIVNIVNSVVKSLPQEMYLTELTRDGDSFTFQGKTKDVEVVAEFMRNLKSNEWFHNVFMSNFTSLKSNAIPGEEPKNQIDEAGYGTFIVTASLSDYAIKAQGGMQVTLAPAVPEQSPQPPVDAGQYEQGAPAPTTAPVANPATAPVANNYGQGAQGGSIPVTQQPITPDAIPMVTPASNENGGV